MVLFALVGPAAKRVMHNDIIDELMNIDEPPLCKDKSVDDFNTSSFNIDEIVKNLPTSVTSNNNALLCSLYSQVEFLRQEAAEKNKVIQSLISYLNANVSAEKTDRAKAVEPVVHPGNTVDKENNGHQLEDEGSLVSDIDLFSSNDNSDYNKCDADIDSDSITEHVRITKGRKLRRKYFNSSKIIETTNAPQSFFGGCSHTSPMYEGITSDDTLDIGDEDFGAWEKYSKGFGSRMLTRMGYRGKGLGKSGEGIVNPIVIKEKKTFVNENSESPKTCKRVNNKVHPWQKGTTLITGSSILLGIAEKKLRRYKAKVRAFPGSTIDDMFDYLKPLLKKKPSNIILHIGTNDSLEKTADEIANELTNLKAFIKNELPTINVFFSCPVMRLDNSKANLVLRKLSVWLKLSTNNVIVNDNIDGTCIGKKGLHLNAKGSGRLAMNFIALMQRL